MEISNFVPYVLHVTFQGGYAQGSYDSKSGTSVVNAREKVHRMVMAWQQTALSMTIDIACCIACERVLLLSLTPLPLAASLAAVVFFSLFITEKLSFKSAVLAGSGLLLGFGVYAIHAGIQRSRSLAILGGIGFAVLGYVGLVEKASFPTKVRILEGTDDHLFNRIAKWAANSWIKQTAEV